MFCRNCGKQLEDSFKVCPYCGEPVSLEESEARRAENSYESYSSYTSVSSEPKKPSRSSAESTGGWKVLGFFLGFFGTVLWFLPIVSLVLYLIWKNDKPKIAKGIGQFTLIGLAGGVALLVIIAVILAILFAITASMTIIETARDFLGGTFDSLNSILENLPIIGR